MTATVDERRRALAQSAPDLSAVKEARAAFDNLRDCQRQLDSDGIEVGVSRQALDELMAAYSAQEAEIARLREVIGVAGDTVDVADRLIERAYGTDDTREWDEAFAKLATARQALRGDAQ